MPLDEETAQQVYDILVGEAGAPEGQRKLFVFNQSKYHTAEYRFQGDLGFGGKFWRTLGLRLDGKFGERWFVNQYQENSTTKSEFQIKETNKALWALQQEWESKA